MSLIDEVKQQQETPLDSLNNENIMQVRLNELTNDLVEAENSLSEAYVEIGKLKAENEHLALVIREMRIEPRNSKFKALMDKIVDTARKYKLQSPIIRK